MGKFKLIATLSLFAAFIFTSQFATAQVQIYTYAYISVKEKTFSDKLNVNVDLGDSPNQLTEGRMFSEILSEKTSYASVLNFMSSLGFELVDTMEEIYHRDGDGGTRAIIFILRKKM